MNEGKREIIKQFLSGSLSQSKAIQELQKAIGGNNVIIVVSCSNGLYSIGNEQGLTEEQMQAKVGNKVHIIIDEDSALLAGSGPTIIQGKEAVFILPDNSR